MTLKVSQLIGMDIYTDGANMIGKVYDVIIDLQKGEVTRLTLEPIRASSKDDAKRIFREKTVMYKSVKAVSNIVLVSPNSMGTGEMEEEVQDEPKKPMPYSYKYKRG